MKHIIRKDELIIMKECWDGWDTFCGGMITDCQDKQYLGLKRYKEKARKSAKELNRYCATRPEGHRHDLWRSATACCRQRSL